MDSDSSRIELYSVEIVGLAVILAALLKVLVHERRVHKTNKSKFVKRYEQFRLINGKI